MANAEFIPNQIITFGSELLDERNCNNSLDKYPMPLIQDGDELKFQFKRGSCQADISYVKPCEPAHDPEAENILAGKKRLMTRRSIGCSTQSPTPERIRLPSGTGFQHSFSSQGRVLS